MSEPTTIVGAAVGPRVEFIEGSITVPCTDCDAMVYVAPSSFPILGEPGTEVICTRCFGWRLHEMPEDEPLKLRKGMPGQKEEIETWRRQHGRKK